MSISEKHSAAARENLKKADAAKAARRITKYCVNCGKVMVLPPSVAARQKFCCWDCRTAYMQGPNAANYGKGQKMKGSYNPNWKGGDATERKARYKVAEQAKWRRAVFYRDSYTCQRCGIKPTKHNYLRAHHIHPWAKYPDLRFSVDNGITLCKDCHDWVHGDKNTNQEFLA